MKYLCDTSSLFHESLDLIVQEKRNHRREMSKASLTSIYCCCGLLERARKMLRERTERESNSPGAEGAFRRLAKTLSSLILSSSLAHQIFSMSFASLSFGSVD
jgi:hypothetical protein